MSSAVSPAKRRRLAKKQAVADQEEEGVELISMYIVPALVLCAASYGLEPSEFKAMLRFGIPIALFNILWVLHRRPSGSGVPLDFIEFFSGCGRIRDAMVAV